jgi:hypothetical protein
VRHIRSDRRWFAHGDRQGFITVDLLQSEDLAWTDFAIRAKRAAENAGFSKNLGGQLVAAIGELYGNVIDHSQRTGTGYAAWSASPGRFEFVVADQGIGVLESLRSNPTYAYLSDHGSALELAIKENVSRYAEPGHGFGFRPIFVGLANISRIIRFRSGDHGHLIVRSSDDGIAARTIQLASLPGMFCSVLCET